MKYSVKSFLGVILTLSMLSQTAFGDIVAERDAVGPAGAAMFSAGGILLIIAVIALVWAISLSVMKMIRHNNVNK